MELGGVEQVKEEVRAIRFGKFLEDFTRELRLALRSLHTAPVRETMLKTVVLVVLDNQTVVDTKIDVNHNANVTRSHLINASEG